jgi:outer membrane protein assembly factor BamB
MNSLASALLAILLAIGPPALRADEIVRLTSAADASIREDSPASSDGTSETLNVQGATGYRARLLVKFDLSAVDTTAAVKNSSLKMQLLTAPLTSRTHSAHRVTGEPSWNESASWNLRDGTNPWDAAGGDFNSNATGTASTGTASDTPLSWSVLTDGSVSNIPQFWLNNPAQNFGLLVRDTSTSAASGSDLASYGSRENIFAANRPALEISLLRNVSLGNVVSGISEFTLNWMFPSGTDRTNYNGVTILGSAGSTAPAFSPVDGTEYVVGQSVQAGEAVAAQTVEPASSGSFSILSVKIENGADFVVLPGTMYSFSVFSRDASNVSTSVAPAANPPRYSSGVSTSASTVSGGGANKYWSYKSGAVALAPPGLDPGNLVITGSADGKLHSMDPLSGARRYQPGNAVGLPGFVGSAIQSRPPVIAAADTTGLDCVPAQPGAQPCDVAYVGADDGRVYAFNAVTGALLWTSPLLTQGGGSVQGAPSVQLKAYSNSSFTSPVDLVFVGTRNSGASSTINNRVYALNAASGAVVWTFNGAGEANLDIISSTPAVDYENNVIYVTSRSNGGSQNSLWKLDSSTGALRDAFALGDIDGSPTLSFSGKLVYAVTNDGELALARTDVPGCSNKLSAGTGAGRGFPIPLLVSSTTDEVYFSTLTTLNKFQVTFSPAAGSCGTEAMTNLNGGGWSNPAIVNPSTPIVDFTSSTTYFYVGDSTGRICKVHPASGAVLQVMDVNLGATIGDPSIDFALGRLYVGDSAGRIYAFKIF